ncbi:ABC transporter permease [Luteitalea sp.]
MILEMKLAARGLLRLLGVTLFSVSSLGVGLGIVAAVYSLVRQVAFRNLSIREPDSLLLVEANGEFPGQASSDHQRSVFSYPIYAAVKARLGSDTRLVARASLPGAIITGAGSNAVLIEMVSGEFMSLLGVGPVAGRMIFESDDRENSRIRVCVLSHRYWSRHHGGSDHAVGQTVRVNGVPLTVVGVAPAEFHGVVVGQDPDVYVPLQLVTEMTADPERLTDRRHRWLTLLTRAGADGASPIGRLSAAYRGALEEDYVVAQAPAAARQSAFASSLALMPIGRGIDKLDGMWRGGMLGLLSLAGMVYVAVCANVAGLSAASAVRRFRETGTMAALGATPLRLAVIEAMRSLLVAILGALVAVVIAEGAVRLVLHRVPESASGGWIQPTALPFSLWLIIGGALVGIGCALLGPIAATVLAAVSRAKDRPLEGQSLSQSRLSHGLVVMQLAMSVAVSIVALTASATLHRLMGVDAGFSEDKVSVTSVDPSLVGYRAEETAVLIARTLEDLRRLPGVAAVSASAASPFDGRSMSTKVTVEGAVADGSDTSSEFNAVSSQYFQVLGMKLLSGRAITSTDTLAAPRVAVVNEAFVRRSLHGREPLGRRFARRSGNVTPDIAIVGVVADAREAGVRQAPVPTYYLSLEQFPSPGRVDIIALAERHDSLPRAVSRHVAELDGHVPVLRSAWLADHIREALFVERTVAAAASVLAAAVTLLAVVGVYGLMNQMAAARLREVAVRLACGATPRSIQRLILGRVALLLGIGVPVGLVAGAAAVRLLRTEVVELEALNLWVLGSCGLWGIAAALVGGYIPSRSASHAEPSMVLRGE